jgi:hypothetical protein
VKRGMRALGASLFTVALVSAAGSSVASAAPGVAVSKLSSLQAGASSGTLTGTVVNGTSKATTAKVTVHLLRRGTQRKLVGTTSVNVAAKGNAAYSVRVKLPAGLKKGNYYLAACTPSGAGDGLYGCATAEQDVKIAGGAPVRGPGALARTAQAAPAETCSSGAHTLSKPGMKVYPETGNGGYTSVHTDVYNVYDAAADTFLPGNHVDLTDKSTQCLSDLSVDFETSNYATANQALFGATELGPNMTVSSISIDGQPATFKFVQPTYPGDPKGQDDPDPLAHQMSLTNPVSATNPNPPACSPPGTSSSFAGQPCPATKLVITPSAPIPSGTTFKVTVNYTGRPGIHVDGDGSTEGFFRSNTPTGDGGFVTTEPLGTMAWMPLNDHPTAKPTYDFYDTVPADRTAIGNGRLIGFTDNPTDPNFPTGGSRTWHWMMPEPVNAYLVENSMGYYTLNERFSTAGTIYYEAQSQSITTTKQASNKTIMDQQEDITNFQSTFNGPFPFSTDGVIIGTPPASFEEEMETKITFAGGSISLQTFNHENMHQWWGDNVSEGAYNLTFFKEGLADLSEGLYMARNDATTAGGLGTPAGDAAFEARLVSRFNTTYNATSPSTYWNVAPSNPQSNQLFSNPNTYSRPGRSYIALRAILGKTAFNSALQDMARTYAGGSITEPQEEAIFHKWIPNQTPACSAKLDAFFTQWWDTAYTGTAASGNKPTITGPGLAGRGFYDANGGCSDFGVTTPGGTVAATLSLTLGSAPTFGAFTPGVAKDYTATMTANVISTAGDAALSVADPSSTAPGHLVNGTFSLPQALQATASSPAGTAATGGALSGSPLSLLTWAAPVSNDSVAVALKQSIGANDALRTGSYAKTLTFTLSTTTP